MNVTVRWWTVSDYSQGTAPPHGWSFCTIMIFEENVSNIMKGAEKLWP